MAHTLRKLRLEVLIPKCGRRLVSGSVLFSQILARSPRYVCTPTCRASSSPIGWSQGKSDETVFRSGSFPHVASPECRPCRRNDSLCTTHRKNKPGPTTKKERSHSGGRPTFFFYAGGSRNSFRCALARVWGFAGDRKAKYPSYKSPSNGGISQRTMPEAGRESTFSFRDTVLHQCENSPRTEHRSIGTCMAFPPPPRRGSRFVVKIIPHRCAPRRPPRRSQGARPWKGPRTGRLGSCRPQAV